MTRCRRPIGHTNPRSFQRSLLDCALSCVGPHTECFLLLLIGKKFNLVSMVCFLTPAFVVGLVPIWHHLAGHSEFKHGLNSLGKELFFFVGGVFLVLGIFMSPYIVSGSVEKLVRGVLVSPGKRFEYAVLAGSKAKVVVGLLIDLLVSIVVFRGPARLSRWCQATTLIVFAEALVFSRKSPLVLKATWAAIWMLLPFATVAGAIYLIRTARLPTASTPRQKLFLVVAVSANCALIQFPYTTAEYFCFIAPLAILAVLAIVSILPTPPKAWLAGVLIFCLLFVIADCTPGWVWSMGVKYEPDAQTARMAVTRAKGLRVDPETARIYDELGGVIAQHAHGRYIYATPDSPEIYFLYGFRNPTRTLWDFFDDPNGRTEKILAAVGYRQVNLVVIRHNPFSSGPVPRDLKDALLQRFPDSVDVGHFEVRWR